MAFMNDDCSHTTSSNGDSKSSDSLNVKLLSCGRVENMPSTARENHIQTSMDEAQSADCAESRTLITDDQQRSPTTVLRVAKLKSRFADTILKAKPTLLSHD
ncbi:unnamed protein product [Ilex paraguariensis]|uniref:Uncharacterized protein n=1 Tax=Ilex paraguariensis TaxID=185542 RepID=A0ABC8QVW6_9AQUA